MLLVPYTLVMKSTPKSRFNRRQLAFKDIVLGTLIWACVLGFFNDYSDVVYAKSYSYLFLAALVLAVLVYLTMLAKKNVLSRFDRQGSLRHKSTVLFGTWLVLFFSKFVFIGAIDLLFAGAVTVDGFLYIMLVVVIATIVQRLAEYIFHHLGDDGLSVQPGV